MLLLKRTIGASILAIAFFQAVPAHAATYYVDTTGNNTHPGTKEKPWWTVAYAVSQMVAGDTTYVRGGTYNEGIIHFKRSGTQAAPIKLLNYPGEAPIIQCIDASQLHRIVLRHEKGGANTIGWITIEGFEIRNCYTGMKWYNLHDSIIRRNWIHDTELDSGILGMGGARVLIDRNIINHNAILDPTPPGGHGIYANGSNYTITNNLIYDNRGYGLQINGTYAFKPLSYPSQDFAESNNWVVANNTFAYSRLAAGIVVYGPLANNARIENNIFYENNAMGNTTQGINFISCCSTGIQIRNNLAYASGSGGTAFLGPRATEGVHYKQSGNIVNTDHPRFVNAPATVPASPNFALSERSPAIDKGLPHSDETDETRSKTLRTAFDDVFFEARRKDFAGTARPQGRAYDIGAYEWRAGGDTQSPTAPVALKVH